MPYVKPKKREALDKRVVGEDAGELTYCLTNVIEQYRRKHGDKYETFANIVGALEQTKNEFQRRVIHPYEDKKIAENGDVYAPLENF